MRGAFEQGRAAALAAFGIKLARNAQAMPAVRPPMGRVAIPETHQAILAARAPTPTSSGPAQPHVQLHSKTLFPEAGEAPAANPRPAVSWGDLHQGVQQQMGSNQNPSAAAATPASRAGGRKQPLAPDLPAPPPANRPPVPGGGGGGGGGGAASRFKLPSLGWKGTLGLMGAGALGAGMLGMHRQNQRDTERERLVYAPMQGGFQ